MKACKALRNHSAALFFMQIYMKGGLFMEMTKAAQEARREYLREWRRSHKDNVKRHNQTYWEKKAREAAKAALSGEDPEEQSTGTQTEQPTGSDDLTDDQLRELVSRKKAIANFKGV